MSTLFRVLGTAFLLIAVALASAFVTMKLVIHRTEVTVPNLIGKPLPQAHHKAAALQLDIRVANHLYSSAIPAGHVLSQSPAPGTTVRAGWHMRVIESLGAQTVAIPALAGESDSVAIVKIREAGLQLGTIAYLPTSAAPPGTVVAQSPMPNAEDIASPRIQLLIAMPPEHDDASAIIMPRLIGQNISNARQILTQSGLKLAHVKRAAVGVRSIGNIMSNNPPQAPILPGSVIAQMPASGYRVQPGDDVILTVAK